MEAPSRILLVRLRQIGDVVLTTPAVHAIRQRFPDARISYLVEPAAAPVLTANPNLNEVIVAPAPGESNRLRKDFVLAARLRRQHFDLAIDFHGGPRSSWFTWASRARTRIGYEVVGRGWMYTTRVARPRELRARHTVENQWDLLRPLGIPPPDPTSHPTEMALDSTARQTVELWLAAQHIDTLTPLLIVHVGAGNRFRMWPAERFVAVVLALATADPRRRFAIIAGPGDDTAARVIEETRSKLPAGTVLVERLWSLEELAALSFRASAYIGCDTGPLHVAGTTPVPIVGLYGPTLPVTWAPWRAPDRVTLPVQIGDLECRPCHQRVCAPGDFRCLTWLAPEQVVAATERALERAKMSPHG